VSYLNELLAGYRQGLADGCQVPITMARDALGRADDPRQRGRLLAVVALALADNAPDVPAEHPVPLTKGARKTPATGTVQPCDDSRDIAACA
jgi:hypothetical protein